MAEQNEKLRVVVVGGVAGGASAAARIKRLNENADVVVFEKGSDVSFSNCGLPYYLSGTVEDSEDLIMMTPAAFRKKHRKKLRSMLRTMWLIIRPTVAIIPVPSMQITAGRPLPAVL